MTVPLDLLVRVREIGDWHRRMNLTLSDAGSNYAATEMYNCPHGKFATALEDLTAQIEQQGQGEPVAWFYYDKDECTWTQVDPAESKRGAVPLYATPQDSVPAWAKGRAILDMLETRESVTRADMPEIESRALALTSAPR